MKTEIAFILDRSGSMDSMTNAAISGFNDVIRIYTITQRDGIDYNLAFIGRDFDQVLPSAFDAAYMRALFDYGYQRALPGYPWAKKPPIA